MISKQKASNQVPHEEQLEDFRLALIALTDGDLWGRLTTWINHADADQLERISTMLKININEQRKIQFDHRLREHIADLSLDDLEYWQTSIHWQKDCKLGAREKTRHFLKRFLKVCHF
jgi:hypothetical protein